MTKQILFLLFSFLAFGVEAQIDLQNSTVSTIPHWNLGETQVYHITESEIALTGEDTTSVEILEFDTQIKVVDSTSAGFIIEWTRKNIKGSVATQVKMENVLLDFPILITIDIYGSSLNLLNWEDIIAHVNGKLARLQADSSMISTQLNQLKRRFRDKESISNSAIRDINQFFVYHGAKYLLGETITTNIKVPNNYGGDPLDATGAIVLDELLPDNNTYIVKSFQNINPQQLTAVTYDYLSRLNIVDGALPAYEEFPTILKQIWGGSEIHGPSGWVIYSQESEQITSGEDVTLRERFIEIVN